MELTSKIARIYRLATADPMSASIAHEVRQPLAAIVSHASAGLHWLNRSNPDLDEVRRALERIASEGHRAAEVVDCVRSAFKSDCTHAAQLAVNGVIRNVMALAASELSKAGIDASMQLGDGPAPYVKCLEIHLHQVILNLVMNAIEAMREATSRVRRLTIRSEVQEKEGNVLITIADTGPGIDPHNFKRLFEPFFTTKAQGMGMGLSICKSIVESQGGRLTARAGRDSGAEFEIALPYSRP